MLDALQALQKFWGFENFRPGQEEIIQTLVSGRSVLGVMPTGAGKSLCYQLPALMLPGMTLVVSPLIALMKDQVDQLNERGIPAAFLNSTQSFQEQQEIFSQAHRGEVKLLYLAPERFRFEGAMAQLKELPIELLAVDEAHCISHWGHDFRPDYKNLQVAIQALQVPRVAAYTATATHDVRLDIIASLGLQDPLVKIAGFARPNLHLSVKHIEKMAEKPRTARVAIQSALADGGSAIVYCATRRHCQEAFEALESLPYSVHIYHGGMGAVEREESQSAFQGSEQSVMIATNAFGMGIDKPDVRMVIHWDCPSSIDAYYQEVGRAGRDGKRAYGLMLFSYADKRIHEFLIQRGLEENHSESAQRMAQIERQKLQFMQRFAFEETCRHQSLLRYFGDHAESCHPDDELGAKCDNCMHATGLLALDRPSLSKYHEPVGHDFVPRPKPRPLTLDEVVVVQKLLSAVVRSHGKMRDSQIAKALRGSRAQDVLRSPLANTKSHGALKGMAGATLMDLIDSLRRAGCLYGHLPRLTPLGTEVMWNRTTVSLEMPPFSHAISRHSRSTGERKSEPSDSLSPEDELLYQAMKEKRLQLARDQEVPPFVVASNALLINIIEKMPKANDEDWLSIHGVGNAKAPKLRKAFQALIEEHRNNPPVSKGNLS